MTLSQGGWTMKTMVAATDVSRRMADYLNRVAYRDEEFVIVRGGKPVAELVPVPRGVRLGELPGLLAALPALAPGDAERFGRDLDGFRHANGLQEGLRDPWRS